MANDPNIGRIAVNKKTGQRQMWMGAARGFEPVDDNNRSAPPDEIKASLGAIEEARARRDASRAVVDGLGTFNKLNQRRGTGPILSNINLPFIGAVNPGRFVTNAINPDAAADYQTMDSIVDRLAPQMRVAGSGATTDKDIEGFKRSIPGTDKFGAANAQISAEYQRLLALNQRRFDELSEQYNRTRSVVGPKPAGRRKIDLNGNPIE